MKGATLDGPRGGVSIFSRLSKFTVVILTVGLSLFLALSTDTFANSSNIISIIYAMSFSAVVSFSFTFLMIMGEIDLSVGSVYGWSGAFTGLLIMKFGIPMPLSIALVLLISAGVGLGIGILVTVGRLNSMMVTLGFLSIFVGLQNMTVTQINKAYAPVYKDIATPTIFGIHWLIVVAIIAVIVLEIFQRKSVLFRRVYIVGQNIDTARIAGIKAVKIKLLFFSLSTVGAALGGILAGARIGSPQIETGNGLEFTLVTAAVLGGASLFGGKGSVLMTYVSLLFLQIISTGLNIYKVEPVAQQIFVGVILVIAVLIDTNMNSESALYRSQRRLRGRSSPDTAAAVSSESNGGGE